MTPPGPSRLPGLAFRASSVGASPEQRAFAAPAESPHDVRDRREVMATVMANAGPRGPQPIFQRYNVHELWYALLPRDWKCLAVVSPDQTPNTWRLARSLAELGTQALGRLVEPVDATGLDLGRVASITHRLAPRGGVPADKQFIVGLDSPIENAIAIGVLAACDTVVLMVEKNRTTIPKARRTIEVVGRDRLAGVVLALD